MASLAEIFIESIIYILPAYVANASPTVFGGGKPLDLGKNFIDGKRIFGDHKTIRGLLAGILCGILTGIFLLPFVPNASLIDNLKRSTLLSIGTHVGDLLGSFIKRRIDIPPGGSFPVIDQIGFLLTALFITIPFYPLPFTHILLLIVLTLVLHPATNLIAYLIGLKDRPY